MPFPLMPLSLPLPPVKPHVPFPLCPCGGCGRRGAASQGRSCDTPVCHLGCSTLLSLVAVEAVELPVTICGKGCYRIEPSSASSPRFSQSLAFTGSCPMWWRETPTVYPTEKPAGVCSERSSLRGSLHLRCLSHHAWFFSRVVLQGCAGCPSFSLFVAVHLLVPTMKDLERAFQ